MGIIERIRVFSQDLALQGLSRSRSIRAEASSFINFSSNDYLSLSDHPTLRRAFSDGFLRYPAGAGSSMVVSGHQSMHRTLERELADALAVDDALLFNSGYTANLAV